MSLLDSLLEEELFSSSFIENGTPSFKYREVWITQRADVPAGWPLTLPYGSGTFDNPYAGTPYKRLDATLGVILFALEIPLHIRFGPGVFQTRGGGGGNNPDIWWQLRSGWKISGAGIFQTTLQLVNAIKQTGDNGNAGYTVMATQSPDFLDGFQVSDLTIDCNLHGQPKTSGLDYPQIMVSALAPSGRNIQVYRVRVINFGTNTSEMECFPLVAGLPWYSTKSFEEKNYNNVVEDCIVEQPATNNIRETTCINVAATVRNSDGLPLNLYGAAIQKCLVDLDYRTQEDSPPLQVKSLSRALGGTTLYTKWVHGWNPGDRIKISGASPSELNGVFKITEIDWDDPTMLKCDLTGSAESGTGDIVVQRVTGPMGIVHVTSVGTTATLQTAVAHNRQAGDWIRVSGVEVSGLSTDPTDNPYNGSFEITALDTDPTKLKYAIAASAGSGTGGTLDRWPNIEIVISDLFKETGPPPRVRLTSAGPHYRIPGDFIQVFGTGTGGTFDGYFKVDDVINANQLWYLAAPTGTPGYQYANIYSRFHAMSEASFNSIIEKNRVYNCQIGGPYQDTWTHRDAAVRNNYYYNVGTGPIKSIDQTDRGWLKNYPNGKAGILTLQGDNQTVQFQTTGGTKHYLQNGFVVEVSEGTVADFRGFYYVSVINDTTFEYRLKQPTANQPSGTYIFDQLFTVERAIYEGNIIELRLHPKQTTSQTVGSGGGIAAGGVVNFWDLPADWDAWIFQRVLIKDNIIRTVDNKIDPWDHYYNSAVGIHITTARELTMENNIVRVIDPAQWYVHEMSVRTGYIQKLHAFNNRTPAGLRLLAFDRITNKNLKEWDSDADDWLLRL